MNDDQGQITTAPTLVPNVSCVIWQHLYPGCFDFIFVLWGGMGEWKPASRYIYSLCSPPFIAKALVLQQGALLVLDNRLQENQCNFNVANNYARSFQQGRSVSAAGYTSCPFQGNKQEGKCQGVKEIRFSGDTLLTGVLLLESGANRSADGVSIWSLTCEICLNRAFPSSRA